MSWVISKKDNYILEGFKRIFKPKYTICENQSCENIIYYFDHQGDKIILYVCNKMGIKLPCPDLLQTLEKHIYCSEICSNCSNNIE